MKHIHMLQPEDDVEAWISEAKSQGLTLSEFIQQYCNRAVGRKSKRKNVGRPKADEPKKGRKSKAEGR